MSTTPLISDLLLANPTLDAHPARYSSHDGDRNINRFVQQLRFFLKWHRMDGQFLDVRGHLPSGAAVEAQFYDHTASAPTPAPIAAQSGYRFAPPGAAAGPTQELALKEIVARYDSRLFSQQILSRQFNQVAFQKRALKHAICSRLEDALINGDSSSTPAEFDGLRRLVERGLGQRLTAGPGDQLNILDEAITRVRAHNRRCDLIVMNQDAWQRVLNLQRARGFRPQFRRNSKLRQGMLVISGVPVCLSDHIPTVTATGGRNTSVFFLSLNKPNGVFGLVSRKRPRLFFTKTSRQDDPFLSYQGHLFAGLASATSDALVELGAWNVTLTAG